MSGRALFGAWTVILVLALSAAAADAAEELRFQRLYPAVEYFLVDKDGSGFTFKLEVKDLNLRWGPMEMLVKVYDPDGRVVVREEILDEITTGILPPWDGEMDYYDRGEIHGVYPMMRWTGFSDNLERIESRTFSYKVPARGAGAYRLLLVGTRDHFVKLKTSRPMKMGVMGELAWVHGHGDQWSASYVYVPKGTRAFFLWFVELDRPQTRRLRLIDPSGKVLVDMPPTPSVGSIVRFAHLSREAYKAGEDHLSERIGLTANTTRSLWEHKSQNFLFRAPEGRLDDKLFRVEISPEGGDFMVSMELEHPSVDCRASFGGSDIGGPAAVFCPDKETARTIRNGVVAYWRDGTPLWHGYQKRAREYISQFKPSDFRLHSGGKPITWQPTGHEKVWLGTLPWRFGSPDFSQDLPQRIDKIIAELGNKDDIDEFYRRLFVGDEVVLADGGARALAIYYTQPLDGNGYYKHPAALRLAVLGLLQRFNQTFTLGDRPGCPPGQALSYGFGYGIHCYETVYWLKDLMDPEAKEILSEAMTMVGDRAAFAYEQSHNASAYFPLIITLAGLVNDDPLSKKFAERYLDRWIKSTRGFGTGITPSGDIAEYFGHASHYCGYSWGGVVRLYLATKDERVLDVVRRGFFMHSHTSLPGLGSSPTSWSSRTNQTYGDWAGACNYLPEIVPEMQLFGFTRTAPPVWQEGKRPLISPGGITYAYVDRRNLELPPWPAESPESFTRDINGGHEFFAVKRPQYYTLVFAGMLTPVFRSDEWGGYCGLGGGNLCTLYRPGAGPVVVSRKKGSAGYGEAYGAWRDTTVHDVVGEFDDHREIRLGASIPVAKLEGNHLTVEGRGRTAPLSYRREYVFDQDSIRVKLQVMSTEMVAVAYGRDVSVATLQEAMPFQDHGTGVEAFDAAGNSLGKVGQDWLSGVSSVQIGKPGKGCRLVFKRPQEVRVGASLWIRLVDGPTHPDEIPQLEYTIEL